MDFQNWFTAEDISDKRLTIRAILWTIFLLAELKTISKICII